MAPESCRVHDESSRTNITFSSCWVPNSRSMTGNTMIEIVKERSTGGANTTESFTVIDESSRTCNTGLDLWVPDCGSCTLDTVVSSVDVVVCCWADAGMGGWVKDVVGGAGHAVVGGEVEE